MSDTSRTGRRDRPSAFYALVGFLSWPVIRLLFRTHWHHATRVPQTGGGVVACNHLSNVDPWPLALGVFPRRGFVFMTKLELFRWPLKPFLYALGGFPVDRSKPDRDALATAVELCRGGELLLMFPEGTRRSKGLRKKFAAGAHSGSARIALRAGVPLIPAAVAGSDRLSRFGPLEVVYGEPVELADLAAMSRREAAEVATERLMESIAQLETEAVERLTRRGRKAAAAGEAPL